MHADIRVPAHVINISVLVSDDLMCAACFVMLIVTWCNCDVNFFTARTATVFKSDKKMRPRRLIGGLTRNKPHVADMASEIKLLSSPVCFFFAMFVCC